MCNYFCYMGVWLGFQSLFWKHQENFLLFQWRNCNPPLLSFHWPIFWILWIKPSTPMVFLIDFFAIVQATYFHILGKFVWCQFKQNSFSVYLLLSDTSLQSRTNKLLYQILQQIKLHMSLFYQFLFKRGLGGDEIILLLSFFFFLKDNFDEEFECNLFRFP